MLGRDVPRIVKFCGIRGIRKKGSGRTQRMHETVEVSPRTDHFRSCYCHIQLFIIAKLHLFTFIDGFSYFIYVFVLGVNTCRTLNTLRNAPEKPSNSSLASNEVCGLTDNHPEP